MINIWSDIHTVRLVKGYMSTCKVPCTVSDTGTGTGTLMFRTVQVCHIGSNLDPETLNYIIGKHVIYATPNFNGFRICHA